MSFADQQTCYCSYSTVYISTMMANMVLTHSASYNTCTILYAYQCPYFFIKSLQCMSRLCVRLVLSCVYVHTYVLVYICIVLSIRYCA